MKRYTRTNGDINIIASSRGDEKKEDEPKKEKKKIKFDFKKKKDNTLHSLNEVEHFLCGFKNLKRYIKLYFLLK